MKKRLGLMTLSLLLVSPALAGGAGKPAAKPAASCKSIAAIVKSDPQFSTLATALEAADLTGELAGSGSYTLFAPTNAAFAKVPSDKLAALLGDPETLSDVLAYHVVGEKANASDLRGASAGTTEQGADVTIKVSGNQIMINDARVVKADIQACNGVVHAIDTVLMPPMDTAAAPAPAAPAPAAPAQPAPAPVASTSAPAAIDIRSIPALPLSGAVTVSTPTSATTTTETSTTDTDTGMTDDTATDDTTDTTDTAEVSSNTLYDVLVADDRFSTLRDLLSDAGLTDMLMTGDYTLFAPTDEAFAALPEGELAAIAGDPEALLSLLRFHVVQGRLTSEQVQAGNLQTVAGSPLTISAELSPAIESSTGLIYPVDAVLLPEGFTVPAAPADDTTSAAPVTNTADTAAAAPVTNTAATTTTTTDAAAPVTNTATTTTSATTTVTTTTTNAAPAQATPGTAQGGAIAGGNLTSPPANVAAVLTDARFSTVRDLLTQAGLLDTLGSGTYTIFLPTNDAFAKLDPAKLNAVKADPALLKQVLSYHVVSGQLNAAGLTASPLTTLAGSPITVTNGASSLSFGGMGMALDGGTPITAGTSTVYVIDTVLLPPSLR